MKFDAITEAKHELFDILQHIQYKEGLGTFLVRADKDAQELIVTVRNGDGCLVPFINKLGFRGFPVRLEYYE